MWADIINEVDTNGDGEISFEEFETMMRKVLINNNDEQAYIKRITNKN